MKFKKLTFNNNIYPYVELPIYDYNYNGTKRYKISTTDLEKDIYSALTSGRDDLKEKVNNIDSDIKYFVPKNLLINSPEEQITKYVEEHCI